MHVLRFHIKNSRIYVSLRRYKMYSTSVISLVFVVHISDQVAGVGRDKSLKVWVFVWAHFPQTGYEDMQTLKHGRKSGGLGKKRVSSKHLWRSNRGAKDSHLCLQNPLLSFSVSLVLLSDSLFILCICSLCAAWQLRTLEPFSVEHMFSSRRFLQV